MDSDADTGRSLNLRTPPNKPNIVVIAANLGVYMPVGTWIAVRKQAQFQ